MRPRRLLPLLLAAALTGGCGITDPDSPEVDRLEAARAIWATQGLRDYTFRLSRECFCLPESIGPAWVSVFNSVLVSRVDYVDTGEPMPDEYARWYLSVEGLFDLIDDALRRGAYRVDVTYDQATGVPLDIYIDYDVQMADEEVGYVAGIPFPIE